MKDASLAQLLEAVFAGSPCALQIYGADGNCRYVNPAFSALFGAVPPPEYNVLRDRVVERAGCQELLRRAFAGETIAVPPVWYDAGESSGCEARRVAVAATCFPLRDAGGAVTHVVMQFEDVTVSMQEREAAEHARADAEQQRLDAERSEQRARFLAQAGKLMAGSLDAEHTLQMVAQLAVPEFADFCIVDLIDGDGIRRVAAAHAERAQQPILDELRRSYAPRPGSPAPAMRAMVDGVPHFLPEITPADLPRYTVDAHHCALLTRLGVRSHLAVPLGARGRALGAISFGYAGSGRRYRRADVRVAEELASRAAVAIDNARLFAEADSARRAAEAASRAKDEFLAMLGHELRNPLAPIATALQLLQLRRNGHHHGELEVRELDVIDRQVKHVIRLVDDLLDVSRITRGKVQLKKSRVEAAVIIGNAVEMASPLLEQRRHRLTVRVPRQGLPLDADDARLAQVVANLLTNAAKYTEPGGEISVTAEADNGEVLLRVRDNGRGIAADMLPRIFDLFVQGQRSPDRAEGGLGLGLALARSLVELHGGSVAAHSEGAERGSEFVVRLPRAVAAPIEVEDAAPRAAAGGLCLQKRVLLVDDNQDAAELLGEVLRSAGHQVVVAHDGPEALGLLRRFHPEVAVLDIGLPVMDGYELARRLRNEPTLDHLRCIAVTGYGQETDRARSRKAGFELHLVKPVDLSALLQALEH